MVPFCKDFVLSSKYDVGNSGGRLFELLWEEGGGSRKHALETPAVCAVEGYFQAPAIGYGLMHLCGSWFRQSPNVQVADQGPAILFGFCHQ